MYADEDRVRRLARNRKSPITLVEIQELAVEVDSRIDAELAGAFYWPFSMDGATDLSATPPAIVRSIATYLTAAAIEYESYAQRNADGIALTNLATFYEKKGGKLLSDLCHGRLLVPTGAGLESPYPIGSAHMSCPAQIESNNPCRHT